MKNLLLMLILTIGLFTLTNCNKKTEKPNFKIGESLPYSVHNISVYFPSADSIKKYKIGVCKEYLQKSEKDYDKPIVAYGYFIGYEYKSVWENYYTTEYDTSGFPISDKKPNKISDKKCEDYWVGNKHISITTFKDSLKIERINYSEEVYEITNGVGILKYDSSSYYDGENNVCIYDNNNNNVTFKVNGIITRKIKHFKDSKNNIIKSVEINNEGDTTIGYKKYNNKHQVIESFCDNNNKYDFILIHKYTYNPDGFIILKEVYNIDKTDIDNYIKNGTCSSFEKSEVGDTKWEYIKRL